ncbi:uncharacterized protein TNCV_3513541 [Trichonephila clavipes]|nr:uncharacterized protein TNCV_3513541 [Trichonephila clavipes]
MATASAVRVVETAKMLAASSQEKVMDCVAMSAASSHFISNGKYTRFADWHFIHKVRLNLVPLNANKKGPVQSLRACRRCGKWDETLPHVVNHCTSYADGTTPCKHASGPLWRSRARSCLKTRLLTLTVCVRIWWHRSTRPSTSSTSPFRSRIGDRPSAKRTKGKLLNTPS